MKRAIAMIVAAAASAAVMLTPLTVIAEESSKGESSSAAEKKDASSEKTEKKKTESSKADKKKESTTANVEFRAIMPQEWLSEGNYEFEITFENATERKHLFLNRENSFMDTVELKKLQTYAVSFSDDVDGYEITCSEFIDDTFIPEDTGKPVVISVKRQKSVSDDIGGDGVITREQADELTAEREVVQKFISNTTIIGLDENDDKQWILFISNKDYIKDRFYETEGKYYTPEEYKKLTDTDAFYCYWLSYHPNDVLDFADPYIEDTIDEEMEYFRDFFEGEQYEGLRTAVGREVREVWEWLLEEYEKTGTMPDLFPVYMDMKNNVEYVIDGGGETETEEVTADEDVEKAEQRVQLRVEEVDSSEIQDPHEHEPQKPTVGESSRNRFGKIIKENIGTIIFVVLFGGALLIVKTFKKRVTEDDEEED